MTSGTWSAVVFGALVAACSGSGDAPEAEGVAASGGSVSAGGAPASGGAPESGGAASLGGTMSTGGAPTMAGGTASSGGETAAGGATASGGTVSAGGQVATGGASSSGGVASAGGVATAGGAPSAGGSVPTCGVECTEGRAHCVRVGACLRCDQYWMDCDGDGSCGDPIDGRNSCGVCGVSCPPGTVCEWVGTLRYACR